MYRKITVKGVEYEYVIGKTHTKIKGLGVFPNSDIGKTQLIQETCECCGEPLSELYSSHIDRTAIAVTPAVVAKKILSTLPQTSGDTFRKLVDA